MAIASADNPEEAYQLSLKKNREEVARHRAKAALPAPAYKGDVSRSEVEPDQEVSEPAEPSEPIPEPEPEPDRAPSRRALPKGLPSYVPAEAKAQAEDEDAAADPAIAHIVGEILRLSARQQNRLISRLAQVCLPLGMRLRARGP